MSTDAPIRRKRTSFPPCFDYRYFQSLGQFIVNDEMARLFAAELRRSGEKHPLLESLCRDLEGDEENPYYAEPDNSYDPSYDFTYFRGRSTITVNKAAARLIADALNKANQKSRVHAALWTLQTDIYRFFKKPSSAINQAAYNAWKFANETDDGSIEIPRECFDALAALFERREYNGIQEDSEEIID
jgi:hypothetical protein